MQHSAEMRRCLEDADIAGAIRLWKHIAPHLPQPRTGEEALCTIHYARTQAGTIAFKKRAYSHSWLLERGLPSGLPDRLKPSAERLYPRIADAVGVTVIAAASVVPEKRALGEAVRGAMNDVVMDHYSSDKPRDPVKIKADMLKARGDFTRRLLSSVSLGWRA